MGRIPKPENKGTNSGRPAPEPADYHDEVSDEQHKRLQAIANEGLDADEEWVLVDGPAW